MPEYLSPGVYVEEIDAGPKPIEGVSTSTAGAVGVTQRGPSRGKPELVTSFADFQRRFGGFLDEPLPALLNQWALNPTEGARWWQFPLAVKGFFDNGGQRLYVKRVFANSTTTPAVAASIDLGTGVLIEITNDAAAADLELRLRTLIGVDTGDAVRVIADGADLGTAFTVASYDGANSTVTLNAAVGAELRANRAYLQVGTWNAPAAGPPDTRTLRVRAKSVGDWGNDLSVRVRPMVGATLKALPDPALGGAAVRTTVSADVVGPSASVTVTSAAGIAVNDHVLLAGREYTVTAVAGPVLTVSPQTPAGTIAAGTSVQRIRRANDSAAPTPNLLVQGASQLYEGALVELDNGTVKNRLIVDFVVGQTVTFTANVTGQLFEGHKLRVVEAEVAARYTRNGVIEAEEVFTNLRLADPASLSNIVRNVNLRSTLIDIETLTGFSATTLDFFPAAPPPTAPDPATVWGELDNGADNNDQLTVDDFVGIDGGSEARTGIQALEDIDEISICVAPGIWSQTVHGALIQHCEILKDRFAVLDPQDGLSLEGIREVRETLDSKYAAIYYPWVEVRDPSVRRNVNVAPSGHMVGIYARVDVERGVHKAPANEVIRGITKIAQDVTKREQDMLNPKGINALRFFPGRGNRVWGARTISSDSSWKYINVRRLFIFVEESIDEGTQWVVFEPNDEALWARVRQTITNFLTSVWRSGALQGVTAAEAFFVKCDRSTMTQDDIDNGRLICQIGIAPVKPAEFVIFRIQQKTIEAQS